MTEPLLDELDRAVAAGLDDAAPALSLAFLDANAVRAHAWGDASPGTPADGDTLFQAASISKPATAFATLRLVAAGELDLDRHVNDVLRSWTLPMPEGWTPRVTVRQLLCHAGALTVHGFPGYARGAAIPTVTQILDGVPPANTAPVRVNGIPGLSAVYSGGGYTILGQILADVTGRPLPELLEELVLRPMRMTGATFVGVLPEALARQAAHGREAGVPLPGGWHDYPELGAAGLWCTPSDLVRFAAGVQAAVAGDAEALLPVEIAREFVTEQMPGWGLGVMLAGEGATRRFMHGGRNAGFLALLAATVAPGQAVAVMANADTAGDLMRNVAATVADHLHWPDYPQPETRNGVGDAGLAGTYVTDGGARLHVTVEAGMLTVTAPGQPVLRFDPASATSWVADSVGVQLEVDQGHLVVHQLGQAIRAARQD